MAHLLMIESWILSSGIYLPKIIRELGHSYTLLCRDQQQYAHFIHGKPHPAAALADHIVTVDTNNYDRLLSCATKLHQKTPFAGVITCCDYYLAATAKLAEALGLASVSPIAIKVANNKAMMREAMARASLAGPKWATVSTLDEALDKANTIGFPLVIKPTDLCGSLLVQRVHNHHELEAAFLAITSSHTNARQQTREAKVLLEEYLIGEEFSVESYSCRGDTGFFGITDKRLAGASGVVEAGHLFPAHLNEESEQAIYQCAKNALIAVGYDHGLAHTEIKLTPKGPRVIEINTRAGGNWISELIRHVKGVNPLEYAVRLALGETLPKTLKSQGSAHSAAIEFLLPTRAGTIHAVHGWQAVSEHPKIVDTLLHPNIVGKSVTAAKDNDAYLGFALSIASKGEDARQILTQALSDVVIEYKSSEANCQALETSTDTSRPQAAMEPV